jgi:N-acetylglutamate synthase-like GNAT family acetyltransferase
MQALNEKCEFKSKQTNEKSKPSFAVIYRSYLKPNRESDYQNAWKTVAQYFVKHRGAIGSCLHQTSDGMWVAYSRWPDQKTRDASWSGEHAPSDELPQEIRDAVKTIQDCLDPDRKLPDICMQVVNDLFLSEKECTKQENDMSFTILPFDSKYQSEVIDLIERIQVGEFSIPIEEAQRKELQSISQSFRKNKGNYWVALFNGKVIGTIAVIDIGHNAFELRDVFLDQECRGKKTGFAKKLLDTVLSWSKEHNVKTIFLGTTLSFKAAHRFYEKHGFREIARQDMPSYCQPMDCDEKFYRLDL